MRRYLVPLLVFALGLGLPNAALSTTYNFAAGTGAPSDLSGWVGGTDNLLIGSNLQLALPFLHNPVNVLTGTYSGCTAGSGSGCAKGTGRTGADGTWSSGTTFTSASGNFTSGDTGKFIRIVERNLDTLGVTYAGTVTFVSSTTLTLSSTPSFSGSMTNAYWVLGVDDGGALANAISSGDIFIPAGTYVIKTGIRVTSSYHNIQCADNAVLIDPAHGTAPQDTTLLQFIGSGYNSVVGCTFQGTNVPVNSSTPPGYDAVAEFNYLLLIGFSNAGGNLILGNHFAYGWANSELQTAGSTSTASNNTEIVNNFFEQCGHYAYAATESNNNTFAFNRVVDCNLGGEGNSGDPAGGSLNAGNIYEYNKLLCVNGAGYNAQGCMFLTGGNAAGINYGGDQVLNNWLTGCGSLSCGGIHLNESNVNGPALYTNNQCGSGCSVH
jgi:hypothetical protein